MATEQTEKTAGNNWSVTVNNNPMVQQPSKPASGSWSVTVNREPPVKQADKPISGGRAVKVKQAPTNKSKRPFISANKTVGCSQSATVKQEQRDEQTGKPVASGSWSVNVAHDAPAKPKAQVLSHRSTAPLPKPDPEEPPQRPAPSKGRLLPIALCVGSVIVACGFFALRQRAQQKAADQRTAQAYAAVTTFITRVEELKKQVPLFEHPLDGPLNDLKPGSAAAASDKELSQYVANAVFAVKTAETRVLDADTGEEQAKQALELLAQHPEHQALSGKMSAGLTEFRNLQHRVEAKCQSVRSLIMAANPRVDQYKRESKNREKK